MEMRIKANYIRNTIITILISGSLFATIIAIMDGNFSILSFIKAALIFGVPFGLVCAISLYLMSNTKIAKLNKIDGKDIIYKGFANHKTEVKTLGGMLFLTNEFLFFIPNNMDMPELQMIIYLDEIKGIERFKSFGFLNNGLSIYHKKTSDNFVVNNVHDWIEELSKLMRKF